MKPSLLSQSELLAFECRLLQAFWMLQSGDTCIAQCFPGHPVYGEKHAVRNEHIVSHTVLKF